MMGGPKNEAVCDAVRAAKGPSGRARLEDAAITLEATKPWLVNNPPMSRRTRMGWSDEQARWSDRCRVRC